MTLCTFNFWLYNYYINIYIFTDGKKLQTSLSINELIFVTNAYEVISDAVSNDCIYSKN